jgi:hypothetical protein
MGSTRRSTEGELPDGVVQAGQADNPNPPEQVAANRAKFEARQRELQSDRQEAAETLRSTQGEVENQYEQSMRDPEHQAMIPEQIAHSLHDPQHSHGGQDQEGNDLFVTRLPQEFDTFRPGAVPATPDSVKKRRDE